MSSEKRDAERAPSLKEQVALLKAENEQLRQELAAVKDALNQLANNVQPIVAYLNSLQQKAQVPQAQEPISQASPLATQVSPLIELGRAFGLIAGEGDKLSSKLQELAIDLLISNINRAKSEAGIMDAIAKAIARKLGAEVEETVEQAFE